MDQTQPTLRGKAVKEAEEMEEGQVYTEGNSKVLTHFFKRITKLQHVRIAYFGD